jgi:hypothetical protein
MIAVAVLVVDGGDGEWLAMLGHMCVSLLSWKGSGEWEGWKGMFFLLV